MADRIMADSLIRDPALIIVSTINRLSAVKEINCLWKTQIDIFAVFVTTVKSMVIE
jgi:hypothetical protein